MTRRPGVGTISAQTARGLLGLVCAACLAGPAQASEADRARFLNIAPTQVPAEPSMEAVRGYRFTPRLWHELAAVVRAHPEVEVERIGASLQARPLLAFHVPAAASATRTTLVFAGIHAMEWISTQTATAALLDVIARPSPHTAVTVIPLLNPDGRAKVEADLRRGEVRYRRGNARNVDLNRDFAVHREPTPVWSKVLPRRHATSAAPLSQPETRALDRLAARERYDRAASLHAFGGFHYFPWSGQWARPDDHATFLALGRAMEAAQGPRAYKTRQLSRWGFFFRAHGSELDHLYGTYGTKAFLIELTRSGIHPARIRDWKTPFRWYNPREPGRHVRQGLEAVRALIDTDLPDDVTQRLP